MKLAHCVLDHHRRALWLAFDEVPFRLWIRRQVGTVLPAAIAVYGGQVAALDELLMLIPPVQAKDFKAVGRSAPELRADTGGWQISALVPSSGIYRKDEDHQAIRNWLEGCFPERNA